jgi:hypothetical protein
MMKWYDF